MFVPEEKLMFHCFSGICGKEGGREKNGRASEVSGLSVTRVFFNCWWGSAVLHLYFLTLIMLCTNVYNNYLGQGSVASLWLHSQVWKESWGQWRTWVSSPPEPQQTSCSPHPMSKKPHPSSVAYGKGEVIYFNLLSEKTRLFVNPFSFKFTSI